MENENVFNIKKIIEKHKWIHLLFWILYSIYLFANPGLYKFGVLPVVGVGIFFFLIYGGAYFFTLRVTSPKFFQNEKIGKGLFIV